MAKIDSVTWSSPANIALVKYWGKHGDQLPLNPSISMTLSKSLSTTKVSWVVADDGPTCHFLFEESPSPLFSKRVQDYISRAVVYMPELARYSLHIASSNNFPHSSGISSSASFMSSLALCLVSAEEKITGRVLSQHEFRRRASFLARLGSGSAARSVYGGFTLWGATPSVPDSSDEYALPVGHLVHPVFQTYRDAILVVSSEAKSLSSSAGHKLMDSNAFGPIRFDQARENIKRLLQILGSGDPDAFALLVEEEAMTLHGLIQTSAGGPILMEPGTIAILRKIRSYRKETGSKACFTLDAGPNVHLLYHEGEAAAIHDFISAELVQHCENGRWTDDDIGQGPLLLNDEV